MFGRLSISFFYALFAFSILAVAIPWDTTSSATITETVTVTATATSVGPTTTAGSTCSTGPIQCCDSLEAASSPIASLLLGLLGIVVEGVDVVLGLTCSPITVIGVGNGGTCSSNVVCCQDNAVGGLISIGCLPITL